MHSFFVRPTHKSEVYELFRLIDPKKGNVPENLELITHTKSVSQADCFVQLLTRRSYRYDERGNKLPNC